MIAQCGDTFNPGEPDKRFRLVSLEQGRYSCYNIIDKNLKVFGGKMGEVYFALIGDIIGSRSIESRAEIQRRLGDKLREINEREGDKNLAAGFVITLGDEFQGLIRAGGSFNPIYAALEIKNAMYPVKLRFAIGIGGMSTDIDPHMAIGADGEAFHRARESMNLVRSYERLHSVPREGDGAVRINSGDNSFDDTVNTLLTLTGVIRKAWTERQGEIARKCLDCMMAEAAFSQTEAAKELGITQGTVSKSLNSSNALAYLGGVGMAARLIDERYGNGGNE